MELFPKFTQMCLPILFVPGSLAAGCRTLLKNKMWEAEELRKVMVISFQVFFVFF
jgi:hypothetical protein